MNIHQAADGVCFASDLLWRGFTHFLTHTLQSAVLKMLGWKYVVASEFSLKESCFLWILSLNGGSQGVTILIKLLALTSNKFYVPHKTCELTLGWRSLLDVYCCGKWASIVRSGTGSISQTGLLVIFSSSWNPWKHTQNFVQGPADIYLWCMVDYRHWDASVFIRVIIWVKLIIYVQF